MRGVLFDVPLCEILKRSPLRFRTHTLSMLFVSGLLVLMLGMPQISHAQGAEDLEHVLWDCAARPEVCATSVDMLERAILHAQNGVAGVRLEDHLERVVASVAAANSVVVHSICKNDPANCATATRAALLNVHQANDAAGTAPRVLNNAVGAVVATITSVGNAEKQTPAARRQLGDALALAADPDLGYVAETTVRENSTRAARVAQALQVQQSFNNGSPVSRKVLMRLASPN